MSNIGRKYFKPLIPPMIWGIPKYLKSKLLKRHSSKYFGIYLENEKLFLDEKLEKYLNYSNGFFVELGANNGVEQSNSLHFEKFKNWKGVLVEPSPENYLKCINNRSNNSQIFCNACVSFDYQGKYVEIAYGDLQSTSSDLESDILNSKNHAANGIPSKRPPIFGAIAATLNQILITSNAPQNIDLLSLDVEGAEIEVLKGLNHTQFRFKYLCIECRNIEKLEKFLSDYGYVLEEKLTQHDYLFKNNLK